MFRRIYASFGSSAPYKVFEDSQPFLRWVREQGLMVGIISNAEYRYQDVILPALGLNQVCLSFSSFSVNVNLDFGLTMRWRRLLINAFLCKIQSTLENGINKVLWKVLLSGFVSTFRIFNTITIFI